MYKLIFVMVLSSGLWACAGNTGDKKKTEQNTNKETVLEQKSDSPSIKNGFQLLETNCFTCHNPNPDVEVKLAPSIGSIKELYVTKGITEDDFNKSLNFYLNNPTAENSKIPEAIKQFGLMPKTVLNENQIRDISHYLYLTKLENKNWFEKEFPKEQSLYSISSKTAN